MAELAELLLPVEGNDEDVASASASSSSSSDVAAPPYFFRASPPAPLFGREIHQQRGRRLDRRLPDPGILTTVSLPQRLPSLSYSHLGCGIPSDTATGSDPNDLDDPMALTLDLFDGISQRPCGVGASLGSISGPISPVRFGVFDGVGDMGSGDPEPGPGKGLEFGVNLEGEGSEWGKDEFFISRRTSALDSGLNNGDSEGPSSVGFRLDTDSDVEGGEDAAMCPCFDELDVSDGMVEDMGLPLCWDCLCIEEERGDLNEDFDWEEVDGRVEEGEALGRVVGDEEDRSMVEEETNAGLEVEVGDAEEEALRNVGWEVLLVVNDIEGDASAGHEGADSYLGEEHEDFVYPSEYEILVGQFSDHESYIEKNLPAAKSVVDCLPSIVMTQVDVADNNTLCAICKDEISMEEVAKQLPCLHHYHTVCILPWLMMRNTCPVCRYELRTDDPDYENLQAQESGSVAAMQESHFRYNFEIFNVE